MTADAKPAQAIPAIMPPYGLVRDFLAPEQVEALLALALARQDDFMPTKVGKGGSAASQLNIRVSSVLRDQQVLAELLEGPTRDLFADLTVAFNHSPFRVDFLELELVAHGDGAFYKRHIDTRTGLDAGSTRVMSGVYYFNHQPKAFTGGALRLYSIGDADRFIDIEPEHNAMLVFPSWAPHEVLPVSCPSGRHIDSRFAVNCWARQRPSPRPQITES